jgi:hypothetical protein
MKRKEFIQNSSILIAGSMIAREKLFEIIDGEIVYGQNKKKYKQVKDWVKADAATLPVNDCHEMVQDAKGRIVLLTNETKIQHNILFKNLKHTNVQYITISLANTVKKNAFVRFPISLSIFQFINFTYTTLFTIYTHHAKLLMH